MCSPITVLLFITLTLALAVERDSQQSHHLPRQSGTWSCGTQPYSPDEYTCFDNGLLCPYQDGLPLLACADHCYDPLVYDCLTDGTLVEPTAQPSNTGIVTISATSTSEVDWLLRDSSIAAQAGRLTIGGSSSSHCPTYIDPKACALLEDITALWLSSTSLATVFLNQHLFIQSDGTVAFSDPGDIARLDQLYDGLGSISLSDTDGVGSVVAPNGLPWQACSSVYTSRDYYELRAFTPALVDLVNTGNLTCEPVTLTALAIGTTDFPWSAWEYV